MTALFQTYGKRRAHLVKGQGTIVEDADGKQYIDFTSGIAVVSLGHAHPAIVKAIQKQSEKLWHVSNLFASPEQEQLASSLVENTHFSHAFFCNSGAEANEAAIKLARKHTGKQSIITMEKSFHGRTFGAMSATGQAKIQDGFGQLLETFRYVPFNDVEQLKASIDDSVAAIMLEVIQGEGGVNSISPEFAEAIQQICDEKSILLIIDEVQTGIGRTGTRYAYEQTTLKPDIISLAKGLGGGFPIGGILGTASLFEAFGPGSHGTTFGGNPLAVAVSQKVIDIIFNDEFLQEVKQKSEYLVEKLQSTLPSTYAVQGKGLLLGIKCPVEVAPYIQQAEEKGLLVVQAGPSVIRLLPPLTVNEEQLDAAVEIITSILQ